MYRRRIDGGDQGDARHDSVVAEEGKRWRKEREQRELTFFFSLSHLSGKKKINLNITLLTLNITQLPN